MTTKTTAATKTVLERLADKRIIIDSSSEGATLVLAVAPNDEVEDCLDEAEAFVCRLLSGCRSVTSVSQRGWEGGRNGMRERVLVEVRTYRAAS